MALQTSGSISIDDLFAEFGGTSFGPRSIKDYYLSSAGLVRAHYSNAGIPSSGTISLTDFYGASKDFVTSLTLGADGTSYHGYDTGIFATIGSVTESFGFGRNFRRFTYTIPSGKNGGFHAANLAFSGNTGTWWSKVYWRGLEFNRVDAIVPEGAYNSDTNITTWSWTYSDQDGKFTDGATAIFRMEP